MDMATDEQVHAQGTVAGASDNREVDAFSGSGPACHKRMKE